jgi:hypothetical protein
MKKYFIILITVIILICVGIACWNFIRKFSSGEKKTQTLSAVVSDVDTIKKFLIVKPQGQTDEIKVIVSDSTKLIKSEFPFNPDNPPVPGTQFTPKQTEIKISDFKAGDEIFIRSLDNISGKKKISGIDLIQILP